ESASERRVAVASALNELASATGTRPELQARLDEVQKGPDKLLAEAAKDLETTLSDIPDTSLALDWPRLCREMSADLSVGPERTLIILNALREQILKTGNARLF